MSYIKKLNTILVFIFLLGIKSDAQSINLYTLNNGGGYNNTMEWSIGESSSIAHFLTAGYILNTGVLQPMTNVVTAINEYGPVVFGPEITVGPIPTSNLLYVKANFKTSYEFLIRYDSALLIDVRCMVEYNNRFYSIQSIERVDRVRAENKFASQLQNNPEGKYWRVVATSQDIA
jgi:hypothetical protein